MFKIENEITENTTRLNYNKICHLQNKNNTNVTEPECFLIYFYVKINKTRENIIIDCRKEWLTFVHCESWAKFYELISQRQHSLYAGRRRGLCTHFLDKNQAPCLMKTLYHNMPRGAAFTDCRNFSILRMNIFMA